MTEVTDIVSIVTEVTDIVSIVTEDDGGNNEDERLPTWMVVLIIIGM